MADITSDDILQQINEVASTLPQGEPEPEDDDRYTFEDAKEKVSRDYPEDYEPGPEYDPNNELVDFLEGKATLERQWRASEAERMRQEFTRTGVVPRSMNFEEWQIHREIVQPQQDLQKALAEDLESLQARYPKSSQGFLKKIRRGEIVPPAGIELVDNALEHWFIDSISQDEFRRMDSEAQRELFSTEDEERQPLRTRSLDIAEPRRVKPRPKVKKAPTYTLPDFTQEEMMEMLNWGLNQKKMRGGK